MVIKVRDTESLEAEIRRNQKSQEEVDRMTANVQPFSYSEWQRAARQEEVPRLVVASGPWFSTGLRLEIPFGARDAIPARE